MSIQSNVKKAATAALVYGLQVSQQVNAIPDYPDRPNPCTGLNPNGTRYKTDGCGDQGSYLPLEILAGVGLLATVIGLSYCYGEQMANSARSCCTRVSMFLGGGTAAEKRSVTAGAEGANYGGQETELMNTV